MSETLHTPILLIIYKRLATTQKVLGAIRQARPRRLYVAANAPASQSAEELAKVAAARSIIQEVDWDCEVISLFRTEHLCAAESISQSISWFLGQEEEGIILEDDCLVDPSFFTFAQALLERYRDDPAVMQIGASNFQNGQIRGTGDYYFSRFAHIWGWATWRRAWQHFHIDVNHHTKPSFRRQLRRLFPSAAARAYWGIVYDYVSSRRLDTWDYQWQFAVWMQNGCAITPNVNLVSNLGFGNDATNTVSENVKWSSMDVGVVPAVLRHPVSAEIDRDADEHTLNQLFGNGSLNWMWVAKTKLTWLIPVPVKKRLKKWLR